MKTSGIYLLKLLSAFLAVSSGTTREQSCRDRGQPSSHPNCLVDGMKQWIYRCLRFLPGRSNPPFGPWPGDSVMMWAAVRWRFGVGGAPSCPRGHLWFCTVGARLPAPTVRQGSNSMHWLGFSVSLLLALWPFTARWRESLNYIAKFNPRGVWRDFSFVSAAGVA